MGAKDKFRKALLDGANPEGQYDFVTDEEKAEVLAELAEQEK